MILFFLLFTFSLNASLSLEEKIGQLLFVHFRGEVANQDAKSLIQEVHVGGFTHYNWSNGLYNANQIKKLNQSLQELSSIPLFLAIDEEGGEVSRLYNGFTQFPGNHTIGKKKEPLFAEQSAEVRGREMLAVGLNMNFAPVVDIACNRKNKIMTNRSFGNNPETVVAFARSALNGYKKAGMIAILKHYPGHGDVDTDSHIGLPVIHKSFQEMKLMELLPFEQLSGDVDVIMTGHLLVPAWDNEKCATLSKIILSHLKSTLGFKGLIISDSLVMKGVRDNAVSVDQAALEALQAGCDIILLSGFAQCPRTGRFELSVSDVKRIHSFIVQAVADGQLALEQVDESVAKILNLKSKYKIYLP